MKPFLKIIFLLSVSVLSSCSVGKKNRTQEDFNVGWYFQLGDIALAYDSSFNDSSWRILDLPHDWSIEGGFNEKNPAGFGGGALPGGIGWYKKIFALDALDSNKRIAIQFDGIYLNSEVWINGQSVGKRPNGYISFEYDLTRFVKFDGKPNILAVKVDNSKQPNSRWYSGSGIYRDVRLVKKSMLGIMVYLFVRLLLQLHPHLFR
jgi:beta-galactosidase